ncbi:MAG: hypothetical protein HYS59_00910 [Candidatus Vogelbacteria bacterium]|nr:hypothetical protein [Candidatus Vogelbacteria bacterium]
MQEQQQGVGPLFGIIIIVLVLVLGGLYYAGSRPSGQSAQTAEEILAQDDASLENLLVQQSSDGVASIEADLSATDLDGLDAEIGAIESEL